MATDDFVIRSIRRLATGDVEVQAVPMDLRPIVVVVPFARSTYGDIDRAVGMALAARRPRVRR